MDPNIQTQLKERFAQLPEVVRNAITSADVEKALRSVSEKHKLHVDQWAKLENEVMLTLLGFQNAEDFPKNIQDEIGVAPDEAASLAADISTIVFEPIREELERGLEHPEAQEKKLSDAEVARTQILSQEGGRPTLLPATPPPTKPTEKAVRAPISSSYSARQPSTERKSVSGDPYREMPI